MDAIKPAPTIRSRGRAIWRRTRWWSVYALIIAAVAAIAYVSAVHAGLERMREDNRQRLEMVSAGLHGDLARLDYLPSLLQMTPDVLALLASPADPHLRGSVNRYLEQVGETVGASAIYVLNRDGVAIAASDWQEASTPIGIDFSFRPYVKDALLHGSGNFYGIGVTSGRAGYYRSYALYDGRQLRGVIIVKVDVGRRALEWKSLPGVVLFVDQSDVVMLSSRDEWMFRPLQPLSARVRAEIVATRRYGNASLMPLGWLTKEHLGLRASLVQLVGNEWLATEHVVNQAGWRLIVLDEVAPVRTNAALLALTAALGTAVLLLIAIVSAQRRRAFRQKLAGQAALQAAHDSLETKVGERTRELRDAVTRLGSEVEVRRAVESDLRVTQGELVHAGKMAVLGQMSAGMVHELNQPLAALRTLSDNACVLLENRRLDDVQRNLQRVVHLVDRLGNLTRQLKAFAHKPELPGSTDSRDSGAQQTILVRQAIGNAQLLLAGRLRDKDVAFDVQVNPADLTLSIDAARLEQVLVNLFGNAIDAMSGQPMRQLRVSARIDEICVIDVVDSGPGIRADILPHLFEPFTTSKPAGEGLGLGLTISAHIVREFGGQLEASNIDGGGACFRIRLPYRRVTGDPSQ
ncbi:sensor histidine kinase [Paraburkholderia flava]|uniref:sensor histidine kinase n=1 Tax=Paraburkholderia flava TaxID=2547393 RepID=UPI00105D186A|nr:ATP-binding protein [Paraburkholderia flava]